MESSAPDEQPAPPTPVGGAVHDALVALLARAGLDYRGGFVDIDGRKIHYLDYGPAERADPLDIPIVLVHGAGPGAGHWYRQIAALSQSRRVLALDNPMFGMSELVDDDEHPTLLGSRFLRGFLDAMEIERADLVGLSLGGAVTLRLTVDSPERVRRLVLIDSAGLGRAIPLAWRFVHAPWLGRALTRPSRFIRNRVFQRYEVTTPEHPDTAAYSEYSHAVRSRPGRPELFQAGMKRFMSWLGQRERFTDEELSAVRRPTLVIWGECDVVFPVSHGERLARGIPNARLEILPGAGHVSFWDQPELANRLLIEFLNET